MAHFSSIKNKPALHFLREAISFEAANSKSYCRSATHFEATINENLRVFFPKLKEVLLDNTVMPGFFIKWSAKELCLTSRILGSHKDFGSSKEKFLMTHENERNVFIIAIHGMLVTLVSRKCLSYALMEDMILYATDFIQESLFVEANKMLPSCQFEFFSILLSNLGAPQLNKINYQLWAISHSCFGGKNVLGQESEDHDVKLSLQIPESMSLLGSYFLKFNSSHEGYLPDADTLLCWINSGHWDDDQLSDWNNQHERKKTHRSNGILRAMDAKFNSLVSMFEAKLVLLSREKVLVESEKHTRENSMEKPLRRHRVAVLKGEEADNSIIQLAGIVNLFTGSNLSDSSSAKLILQELCRSIKAVISDGYERLVMKLNMIDAKITRNLNEMVDLELELGAASASEYHKLLIPLIKSYMLSRLDFLPEYHVQEEPVAHTRSDANKGATQEKEVLIARRGCGH